MKPWGCTSIISLRIRGPILVHGNQIGPLGIDAVAMRASDGSLIIPGDAVQGKLRESFDELTGSDPFHRSRENDTGIAIKKGSKGEFEDTLRQNLEAAQNPYPLFISDFRCAATGLRGPGERTISNIKMDPNTGTAAEKMLRVLDCPVEPGREVEFTGVVRFLSSSQEDAKRIMKAILSALQWIPHFGSQGTVGFGKVIAVETIEENYVDLLDEINLLAQSIESSRVSVDGTIVDYRLQDLLCVPEGIVNGNIYESRDTIPGEVMKGALAAFLRALLDDRKSLSLEDATGCPEVLSPLCRQFSRLRMTTARPLPVRKRHREHEWLEMPQLTRQSLG